MAICPSLKHSWWIAAALALPIVFLLSPTISAQRVGIPSTGASASVAGNAVDMGAVPSSQMLTLKVRLKPPVDRVVALEQEIADQQTAGSASYRQWLTPAEFAERFGATDEQIAAVVGWLESQGLALGNTSGAVSAGKTRLTVTGSAARVQAAFGVKLRRYRVGGDVYFASVESASVPVAIAELVAGVSGLDDEPAPPMLVKPMGAGGVALPVETGLDALETIEAVIDANAASMLTVSSAACSAEFVQSDYDAWRAALRQAVVQGITVLAASGCKDSSGKGGSFPASLAEVTAVSPSALEAADPTHRIEQERDEWGTQMEATGDFVGIAQRPEWQFAEGLTADGFRDEPDVTADVAALAQTLAEVAREAGTRLGNVAPVLYELAKTPGLYTQPDDASAGTWERATGLGIVDLKVLAEAFPRGTIGTSSLLVASNYAPYHGTSLTLTATVTSTGGSGIPTGTVTFTSTQQGTLGTGTLNAQGVATFTSNSLPGGTYTLTSLYSGDATYTGSTSGVATITVVGEPSIITATIAAGAAVGGSASILVSVTSASGVGTPSGTVTVAPQGTTNTSTASATLTGSNGTATGTVLLPVYQAGTFTLLVSCTDPDPSFTCYSPVSVQLTVAKGTSTGSQGATSTTLSLSPAVPSAGAATTLMATIQSLVTNPNASPFTGSVQFLVNDKLLGTAAVTGGMATLVTTLPAGMAESLVAIYSGDTNWGSSTSNAVTVSVAALATTTAVSSNVTQVISGVEVLLTATVMGTSAGGSLKAPSGLVDFYDTYNGVLSKLGSATLASSGANTSQAMFNETELPTGTHVIYAMYEGDTIYIGSTSGTITLGATNFAVSFVPASMSLSQGQSGSVEVQVNFQGGFSGSVAFGCTPPANVEMTCSFNPAVVTAAGSMAGSTTRMTTMTVTTVAPSARSGGEQSRLLERFAGGTLMALLLIGIQPQRHRIRLALLLVVIAMGAQGLTGCSGTNSAKSGTGPSSPTDPGSALGTQVLAITTAGSDGTNTVRHDYTYQVTVQ